MTSKRIKLTLPAAEIHMVARALLRTCNVNCCCRGLLETLAAAEAGAESVMVVLCEEAVETCAGDALERRLVAERDAAPPPANLAAEQAVLGFLLRRPRSRSATAIAAALRPEHFADPIHARIYAVARSFAPEGTGMHDLRRIGDALGAELSEVGGAAYLHQLALLAPVTKAAGIAAAAVREAWARRELIDLGGQLACLGGEVVAGAFDAAGTDTAEQAGYLAARMRGLIARLGAVTGRAAQ